MRMELMRRVTRLSLHLSILVSAAPIAGAAAPPPVSPTRATLSLPDNTANNRAVRDGRFYTGTFNVESTGSPGLRMRGYDTTENGGTITSISVCLYNTSARLRNFLADVSVSQNEEVVQSIMFQTGFPERRHTCHTLSRFDAEVAPGEFYITVSYKRFEAQNFWLRLSATTSGDLFDVQLGNDRPPFLAGSQGPIPIRGVGIRYLMDENEMPPPPVAPSDLAAAAISSTEVELAWSDNSSNEEAFDVERRIAGGTFAIVASIPENATGAILGGHQPDTTYDFRVRARNAAGSSDWSDIASATTLMEPFELLAAPSDLDAVTVSSSEIAIFWSDNSDNEDDFEIELRAEMGSFSSFGTVGADETGAAIIGLEPLTTYEFRVRARNSNGVSDWSNLASARTTSACTTDTILCVEERFRVEVTWRDRKGNTGVGRVVDFQAANSGLFWFFNSNNWEMMVKVLDGCSISDHFWVFAAATTDVEYTLRVTDTATGEEREYFNPLGTAAAAVTDTEAFATCSASAPITLAGSAHRSGPRARDAVEEVPRTKRDSLEQAMGASLRPQTMESGGSLVRRVRVAERGNGCSPDAATMCLNEERFQVEVFWTDFDGDTGVGEVVEFRAANSGVFWFFNSENWEMMVKVLDGCGITDHYWVFAAATTNVEYTLRVTDTATGDMKEYFNPLRTSAPAITDTAAFATCP